MSIGIYLLIIGTIGFVGGMVQMGPKILILISVILMAAGLIVTTTCEAIMQSKIDDLTDRVKNLRKGEKKMPRYIDVDNVKLKGISVFDQNLEILIPLSDVRKALQMTLKADVQEVKHGKWIWRKDDCSERECICSICESELPHTFTGGTIEHPFIEKEYIEETDYCPLCGARMDGDEK